MCTLTLVPLENGGVSAGFNRDELRSRPPAFPPANHTIRGRSALFPVDPQSGGTWIGINDAGLFLAVLNVNLPNPQSIVGKKSRGSLIPQWLQYSSLSEIAWCVDELDPAAHPPFRLIGWSKGVQAEWRSNGIAVSEIQSGALARPAMFTSSGLGDHLVESPRRELFEQMFSAFDTTATQVAFHNHTWPDAPQFSVFMNRRDACTVNQNFITISEAMAEMVYIPTPGGEQLGQRVVNLMTAKREVCV